MKAYNEGIDARCFMFKMFIKLNRNFQIKNCPYSNANKSFKYIYYPKIFILSHLIANNMQRKTVRIYSFSNGRPKQTHAQNFDTALYNLNIKNCF